MRARGACRFMHRRDRMGAGVRGGGARVRADPRAGAGTCAQVCACVLRIRALRCAGGKSDHACVCAWGREVCAQVCARACGRARMRLGVGGCACVGIARRYMRRLRTRAQRMNMCAWVLECVCLRAGLGCVGMRKYGRVGGACACAQTCSCACMVVRHTRECGLRAEACALM